MLYLLVGKAKIFNQKIFICALKTIYEDKKGMKKRSNWLMYLLIFVVTAIALSNRLDDKKTKLVFKNVKFTVAREPQFINCDGANKADCLVNIYTTEGPVFKIEFPGEKDVPVETVKKDFTVGLIKDCVAYEGKYGTTLFSCTINN